MRFFLAVLLVASTTYGSEVSIGVDGINSAVTGLTGAGVRIGQYEMNRPGKAGYDFPENSALNTVPFRVYHLNGGNIEDSRNSGNYDHHATQVAGVMIGNNNSGAKFKGVAPMAELWSYGNDISDDFNSSAAINTLINRAGDQIKGMNLSWSRPLDGLNDMDGHSHITAYIDWASRRYDMLFVVSGGNENNPLARTPVDNFNGIAVGFTAQASGQDKYQHWSSNNSNIGMVQNDDRTLIDIVAPGEALDVLGLGNYEDPFGVSGSSVAAAHVTGAIALLHQHVGIRQSFGWPRMTNEARNHLVTKANILNSAAKISGINGAKMTLCADYNTPCATWIDGPAYADPYLSQDPKLGTGQLNVEQATKQIDGGNYDPGEMIAKSGWDKGIIGLGSSDVYYDFAGKLNAGEWVSVTLVWDRVSSPSSGNSYIYGDMFPPWNVTSDIYPNLDLSIESRTTGVTPTFLAQSYTFHNNVEHLFFQMTNTDDYRIHIRHDPEGNFAEYGLSWFIGSAATIGPPGDYNRNGSVGPEDYDVWKTNFGTTFADADGNGDGTVDAADYTVWRNNFTAGSGSLASVPEPSAAWLALVGLVLCVPRCRSSIAHGSAADTAFDS